MNAYSQFSDEINSYYEAKINEGIPLQQVEKADPIIRDKWINEKRYNDLVSYIHENWDSGNCDEFSDPLSQHLINIKELNLFKRLWKGIIRQRLNVLWNDLNLLKILNPKIIKETIIGTDIAGFNQFSSNESYQRRVAWDRLYAMQGINDFINGLNQMGDNNEIEMQNKLLQIVEDLDKPKPKKSTDRRNIDDNLFWEIIESNRKRSDNSYDFIENIKETLLSFTSKEIRKFHRILFLRLAELNSWDCWALAYIVRRGCGDDAFDYFKAWTISKGKATFETIRLLDENKLVEVIDEDPQLELFLYVAEEAYECKTSEPMPMPRMKTQKMTGRMWVETELKNDFQSLCRLFNYL